MQKKIREAIVVRCSHTNMQMRFFEIVAFYLPQGGSIRGFFLGGMDTYEHMLCFFTQGIRFWGQKY